MWHTDYKLLDDGRWFIAYMDDASRFITGYGIYKNTTGKNALEVLHRAIRYYSMSASSMFWMMVQKSRFIPMLQVLIEVNYMMLIEIQYTILESQVKWK